MSQGLSFFSNGLYLIHDFNQCFDPCAVLSRRLTDDQRNQKLRVLYEESLWRAADIDAHDCPSRREAHFQSMRSSIFDRTNNKLFRSSVYSLGAYISERKYGPTKCRSDKHWVPRSERVADDHANSRTRIGKALILKVQKKMIRTFDEFHLFLNQYGFTIAVLSDENNSLHGYLKTHREAKWKEAYKTLGIQLVNAYGQPLTATDLKKLHEL